MFVYPSPDDVFDQLGDKVLEILARGVTHARADLAVYREVFPAFVSRHTPRGLANWIHDQMAGWVLGQVEGLPGITVVDDEVTREFVSGLQFRVRLKRHDELGRITNYPTQSALDFFTQPNGQEVMPGLEKFNLAGGYRWLADRNEIGSAVLSLRDGLENIIWLRDLPEPPIAGGGTVSPVRPPYDGPPRPKLGDHEEDGKDDEGEAGEL